MKVALVAIAKNEDHYIDEWIKYNQRIGFDDIYIYGDEWELPNKEKYKNVFFEYIKRSKNKSDIVKTHQVQVYRKFCNEHYKDYDFAAFFDIDEFFYTKKFNNNIKKFLEDYKSFPAIGINWLYFGDNNLDDVKDNNYSVLKRFTKSDINICKVIKTIVNFDIVKNNFTMHNHSIMKNNIFNVYDVNKNVISFDIDRDILVNNKNQGLNNCFYIGYLAHFRVKTYGEFIEKVNRNIDGFGDMNWTIHEKEFNIYNRNDVENTDFNGYYQ